MDKIAYTREEDGKISIVYPMPKRDLEKIVGFLTDDQYKSLVWEKSVPRGAISPRYIADHEIPIDREFRDAWIMNEDNEIEIDLNAAIQLKIDKFKPLQEQKIVEVNEYLKMASSEFDYETYNELLVYKQKLMQYDQEIKAISTFEQLQVMTPTIFNQTLSQVQIEAKIRNNIAKRIADLDAKERQLDLKNQEFSSAIEAIKGFLMMIPDIQESLSEIQTKLNNGN